MSRPDIEGIRRFAAERWPQDNWRATLLNLCDDYERLEAERDAFQRAAGANAAAAVATGEALEKLRAQADALAGALRGALTRWLSEDDSYAAEEKGRAALRVYEAGWGA